jgi:hypothetical protein
MTFKFHWTASVTASAPNIDVVWGVRGRSYANDDPLGATMGTGVTVTDSLLAINDVHISAATSGISLAGTSAAGNPVIFEIYRDAGVTGDSYGSDARFLGLEITYTAS